MVFPQVISAFHALFDAIGLPGNLLVIVTIALETKFHVIRYILLASLALSDFLFLILVNSFRIASLAQERWLYGEIMCRLSPVFGGYYYVNTVLHLMAVSYDRYLATVKSPLTYDGAITKCKMALIALIWVIPIPISIGPLIGWGKHVYNPEVFFCQQGWTAQSGSSGWKTTMAIAFFALPFLVIVILNWLVYKAAKAQANAEVIQIGILAGTESQQQEFSRQRTQRKAAVDVAIIIAAFLLCYLPTWIVGFFRQFVKSIDVPAEAVLLNSCIFMVSSLCNPIIYSIRKREFRKGVKNLLRRIQLQVSSNGIENNMFAMRNLRLNANLDANGSAPTSPAAFATQHQEDCMEIQEQMR